MATQQERLQILKMLEEGKIKADEAARLIEALEKISAPPHSPEKPPMPGETPMGAGGRTTRWLRVRVTDTDSGKVRVNVRLPVGLIKAGAKFGAKFSPEIEGLDIDELMSYIDSGEMGQIVDVQDEEDGEHVEVFIE
jgi:hypothetical protein